MDNRNDRDDKDRRNKRRQYGYILVMALLISWLAMTLISQVGKGSNEEISYNKFLNMVERGEVEKVKIGSEKLTIYPKRRTKIMLRSHSSSIRIKPTLQVWSMTRI